MADKLNITLAKLTETYGLASIIDELENIARHEIRQCLDEGDICGAQKWMAAANAIGNCCQSSREV